MFRTVRTGALAIGCLAIFSFPAVAQDVPADAAGFTELVAARLRAETGGAAVVIQGPLALKLGELQVNFDRIFAFCKRNADACAAEVDRYVKGAAELYRERTVPPSKDMVRIVIRPAAYADAARSSLGPAAEMQPRPFIAGLIALPVLDSPRSVKMAGPKDSAALGLTEQETVELGLANLRRTLPPLMDVAKAVGKGQIARLAGDVYDPSRLLLVDAWAPLAAAQNGVLIVAIPTTDAVLYIGEDSGAAVDALRALVRQTMVRAPNKLAATLLRWKATGWEVVAP